MRGDSEMRWKPTAGRAAARHGASYGPLATDGPSAPRQQATKPALHDLAIELYESPDRVVGPLGAMIALAREVYGPDHEERRAAVIEDPFDDRAREVFAASIATSDPQRAELIRAQLRIARDGAGISEYDRVEELLACHGRAWDAGELGDDLSAVVSTGWRRGFIERVTIGAQDLLEHADELVNRVPLLAVELTSLGGLELQRLLALPLVRRLRALGLARLDLGDTQARLLASSSSLAHLRWLDLSGNAIGDDGFRALLESPHLQAVRWLGLAGNRTRMNPRPGGREAGEVLDAWWPRELEGRAVPEWVHHNAAGRHLLWFETL